MWTDEDMQEQAFLMELEEQRAREMEDVLREEEEAAALREEEERAADEDYAKDAAAYADEDRYERTLWNQR